jgi:hypothetical protein
VRAARQGISVALCAISLILATGAQGEQIVKLDAKFTPDRLGTPTTMQFGFNVSSSVAGTIPSPVVGVDLYLPAGMGLASSTLGLAICQPARLLAFGLRGCPANARVGFGTALGQVRAEGDVINEAATVQALLGPNVNGHEQVLFYVESDSPVLTELVFPGELLPSGSSAFSGHLDTSIPIVPAWTDGPDVAVTAFTSTLGPLGLTYYRHVRGSYVPFHPRGISVPERCPAGGFPFLVTLAFQDGSFVNARHAVPCKG